MKFSFMSEAPEDDVLDGDLDFTQGKQADPGNAIPDEEEGADPGELGPEPGEEEEVPGDMPDEEGADEGGFGDEMGGSEPPPAPEASADELGEVSDETKILSLLDDFEKLETGLSELDDLHQAIVTSETDKKKLETLQVLGDEIENLQEKLQFTLENGFDSMDYKKLLVIFVFIQANFQIIGKLLNSMAKTAAEEDKK